jgi:hypothetical protein
LNVSPDQGNSPAIRSVDTDPLVEPEPVAVPEVETTLVRAAAGRTYVESARKIGPYLLNTFYDGHFPKAHDLGRKRPSLRALARRTDRDGSAAFSWRSLAIVEQWPLLPPEIASSLPLGHHPGLLSETGREPEAAMTAAAVESRWHGGEMFESARQSLPAGAPVEPRRGCRPQATRARAVQPIRKLPAGDERLCRDEGTLAAVPKHEPAILGEELDAVIDRLDSTRGVVEDSAQGCGGALAVPGGGMP